MSAAFIRLKLPEQGDRGTAAYTSRLFFGRYIPFRSVVIPGLEAFWLVVSSFAVFALSRQATGVSGPWSWGQAAALAVIYLGALFLMDLYSLDQIERRGELMTNLVEAMGLVCVAVSAVQYAFGFLTFSVSLVLLQVGLTIALMVFARTVLGPRLLKRGGSLPVGFIGGARARAGIEKEQPALTRLGFAIESLGESVQQAAKWFPETVRGRGLRHLVIDDACLGKRESYDFFAECVSEGIEIVSLSAFCERALGKVTLGPHLISDLRIAERNPANIAGNRFRRWRDLLAAALGLVIALPVGILLAVAIKCDSAGPVFFTQERIGKNGRRFRMIKFRSMHQNMHVGHGPAWTTHEHDPRVTRVGAVMRLFHLDELPQLFNVLRGEMSLVGPRPFHPEHNAKLDTSPFFRLRLLVPPGITGWAQIRCHYAASVDDHQEVLSRDLFYVKHAGVLFDLFVIFDTFRVCLWQKGAR
jgi:exopolysaccharide biosynthesis polyprenyl glycosylphosphotransferase